ncbi:EthD family reductase [Sandarakinorhabdus rubra]|uniref:EthD family reductase n=1 Tax=Sandarakinorhabdus rubra TaxID=2672568 RepID=UPI0013DD76DF|nr:EthD family reductase [Sandarakinorhabdus rubra]
MFKLVALWSAPKPEDVAAFEKAYVGTHAPLARALPNLAGLETIRFAEGLEGAAPDYYRIAVMSWADKAAFERDGQTPEWTALRADAGQMLERFGVTLASSMGEDA